ncbi:hydroxypyruvate isomerase family protein [Neisseriaceae bacterium TC5R-5]|nr:hydroxypyruvate isomerase family protein [Neisseriaceae bacterium TC5R-5]
MPRFAANLTMLYNEHSFPQRFAAAAADGFRAVECLFPYSLSPTELSSTLQQHALTLALFNLPAGDWEAGERGLAALPGKEQAFAATLEQALSYARASGCRRIHAMAGLIPAGADLHAMRDTYLHNLRLAARRCAADGITLLIEAINTRDMPGYFLNYQQQAIDIIEEVAEPNLKLQFDCYHCQIMEGDLSQRLQRYLPQIGHIQIAGVPERHEPDSGEIHYPHLFTLLDQQNYDGYIGCEYRPRHRTSDGLGWLRAWRQTQ